MGPVARLATLRLLSETPVGVVLLGVIGTIGIVALALDEVVGWSMVCIPGLAAAVILWIFFTVMGITWVHRCRANMLDSPDEEGMLEVTLDSVLSVFKFCVIAHIYMTLVVLSFALWLLHMINDANPGYCLIPLYLLGALHILASIILRPPDISPMLHLSWGLCMLGHLIAVTLQLVCESCEKWSWVVIFTPSWLTYLSIAFVFRWPTTDYPAARFRAKVGTFGVLMLLVAQIGLAMRLDEYTFFMGAFFSKTPWPVILIPALLASILLAAAVGPGASRRLLGHLQTIVNSADDDQHFDALQEQSLFEATPRSPRTLFTGPVIRHNSGVSAPAG